MLLYTTDWISSSSMITVRTIYVAECFATKLMLSQPQLNIFLFAIYNYFLTSTFIKTLLWKRCIYITISEQSFGIIFSTDFTHIQMACPVFYYCNKLWVVISHYRIQFAKTHNQMQQMQYPMVQNPMYIFSVMLRSSSMRPVFLI